MKRMLSGTLIFLILIGILAPFSGIVRVKGADPSTGETPTQVLDFGNGTEEAITDFGNGTRNCIEETFFQNNTQLLAPNETDGSQISIPTSPLGQEESAQTNRALLSSDDPPQEVYDNQTIEMTQSMMLGFTYSLAYWQEQWNQSGGWWIFTWYLEVGATIDIQFGLRLPINITLEYPEQMTMGNNYTIQATLNPAEPPNFKELLFVFEADIWAQASLNGINLPRTVLFGPDYDYSQSFMTPLGSSSPPLFPALVKIDIFKLIELLFPQYKKVLDLISYVVVPYLEVEPTFGSNSITAFANASGNAKVVEGANLNWTEPNETLTLTVNADNYDASANYSMLILSDFRYYFTKFGLDFKLLFDLNDAINYFLNIADPEVNLGTVDLSWIINYLGAPYLGSHAGYPSNIHVLLNVQGVIISQPPEDVAISYAAVWPPSVFLGQNVNVTIGAANLGNTSETFNVTTYANGTAIDEQLVPALAPGEETMLSFNWTTAGLSAWDTYNITAEASRVPNEIDTNNNVLFAGFVQIVLPNPNANFTYSPMPPLQNQTVTFDASSSVPGSGSITEYIWNFGEGGSNVTTSNSTKTYVFALAGNHKVSLTVIDSDGLNNTIMEVIDVVEQGHNVTVTNITAPVWIYQDVRVVRDCANVSVTVENAGEFAEDAWVTLYYNITANEIIGAYPVHLGIGQGYVLTFIWNTVNVPCRTYTLTAVATIPTGSNALSDGNITVRLPGDANGDGRVNLKDIALVARAIGCTPTSSRWNAALDMNGDGKVDMQDIALVARNFGRS